MTKGRRRELEQFPCRAKSGEAEAIGPLVTAAEAQGMGVCQWLGIRDDGQPIPGSF